MGHNITLMMEFGWLCTALVSLSPSLLLLVHADQTPQKLLKLISSSISNNNSGNTTKCNNCSSTTTTSTADTDDQRTLFEGQQQVGSNTAATDQQQQQSIAGGFGGNDDHDDYQRLLDWLMTLVYTLITLFGIIGNIFVVIVVRTVPGMITPTNCYLMSLAISDCIFLLSAAPVELSFLHVDWYAFGSIGCKVLSFLPFLGINSSSMSITAFTVERFIGICYPLRARYICTVKRAKLIILFIWCFCILYNSPWLYLATLIDHGQDVQCSFRLERDDWAYKVIFVADFSAFYLIPMIMYIYIYTKIIYTLTRREMKYSIGNDLIHRNSQEVRTELLANTSLKMSVSETPDSPTSADGNKNVPNRSHGRDSVIISGCGNGVRSSATMAKVQVIKMLALVVFIFAVCWLPYRAMVMYNSFAKNFNAEMWNPEWFIYLSKTMIFFNCAINPVLYNLMSARFRQAFLRLLSGKKPFINSYKRESLCAQTTAANGKLPLMSGGGGGVQQQRFASTYRTGSARSNASGGGLLLSRMTATDAETRATLLLRVQRDGNTTCHSISVPTSSHGGSQQQTVGE